MNRARNDAHGKDIFKRFKAIVERFLDANIYHVATVPEDDQLNSGVSRCNPVMLSAPNSRSAKAIMGLAELITGPKATPVNEDAEAFFASETAT